MTKRPSPKLILPGADAPPVAPLSGILRKGTCSTCALKVREETTNAQGVTEGRLFCRRDPPVPVTLKALIPVAALGPGGPDLPPGSLVEQQIATVSLFPFVRPDWFCESWTALSKRPTSQPGGGEA